MTYYVNLNMKTVFYDPLDHVYDYEQKKWKGPETEEMRKDFDLAAQALKQNQPHHAIHILQEDEKKGSKAAQYFLGLIYLNNKDLEKGVAYLEKAQKTFPIASYLLGIIHYTDTYGRKDLDKALEYFSEVDKNKDKMSDAILLNTHILIGLSHFEKKDLSLDDIEKYLFPTVNNAYHRPKQYNSENSGLDPLSQQKVLNLYAKIQADCFYKRLQNTSKHADIEHAKQFCLGIIDEALEILPLEELEQIEYSANISFLASKYNESNEYDRKGHLFNAKEKSTLTAKKIWEEKINHQHDPVTNLCNLGRAYFSNKGAFHTKDHYEKAVECWQKALEQSQGKDPRALYLLGLAYCGGKGVSKDLIKGKELLKKAEQQGLIAARVALEYLSNPDKLKNKGDLKREPRAIIDPKLDLDSPNLELERAIRTNKTWLSKIVYHITETKLSNILKIIGISGACLGALVGTLTTLTIFFPHVMIPIFIVTGSLALIVTVALVHCQA